MCSSDLAVAVGDACEGSPFTTDTDGDGVMDFFDCAPLEASWTTILECYGDRDGDGLTDIQEAQRGTDPLLPDTDNDGVMDVLDCAPVDAAIGAAGSCDGVVRMDVDPDGDGIGLGDNCPFVANSTQRDSDADGFGDDCDLSPDEIAPATRDTDGDSLMDDADNCPLVPNSDQADADLDGRGDRCEGDWDADGVADAADLCPSHFNPDQADQDGDGRGDPCDEDFIQPSQSTGGDGGCSLLPAASAEKTSGIHVVTLFGLIWLILRQSHKKI